MNSYRTLTFQELNLLHDDFTHFLYHEGFSEFDFRVLEDQYSEYALDILNRYSDQTFEKAMKSIDYLERLKNNRLTTICCRESYFDIAAIDLKSTEGSPLLPNKKWQNKTKLSDDAVKIHFKKVDYSIQREQEIFDLVEKGFQPTTSKNHNYIKSLKKMQVN